MDRTNTEDTNGGSAAADDRDDAPIGDPESALSAADQTAADADQTAADADQTLSDSDQTGAEDDQRSADADQAASDRDQAASDRERERIDDEEMNRAFAASKAERERSTVQRDETSDLRSVTMFERADHGTKRDEQALLRDGRAAARDHAAELREEMLASKPGAGSDTLIELRAQAAADRARAADDRRRAADDRRQAAEDRKRALAELERAHLDELTGFYMRRLGMRVLQGEINRGLRTGAPLVFAYCDVDGLKRVNDESGHDAGDEVLRAVAAAIRARLRDYDSVVRVGGDEFICALPGAVLDEARDVLAQVQQELSAGGCTTTLSYGLASLETGDSLTALITRSDQNLAEVRADR